MPSARHPESDPQRQRRCGSATSRRAARPLDGATAPRRTGLSRFDRPCVTRILLIVVRDRASRLSSCGASGFLLNLFGRRPRSFIRGLFLLGGLMSLKTVLLCAIALTAGVGASVGAETKSKAPTRPYTLAICI